MLLNLKLVYQLWANFDTKFDRGSEIFKWIYMSNDLRGPPLSHWWVEGGYSYVKTYGDVVQKLVCFFARNPQIWVPIFLKNIPSYGFDKIFQGLLFRCVSVWQNHKKWIAMFRRIPRYAWVPIFGKITHKT